MAPTKKVQRYVESKIKNVDLQIFGLDFNDGQMVALTGFKFASYYSNFS